MSYWSSDVCSSDLAGVADGAGADAVRRRRAAGLAWRPAGRPPPARRPFAQYRGGPGVRADGAAAGAGAADPGADAAAPDRHPGALAAELSRLVRRSRDPVGGAPHAPGTVDLAQPRLPDRAAARALGARGRRRHHGAGLPVAFEIGRANV